MLSLPEELNHRGSNACLAQLTQGLTTQPAQVVVDATALHRFDSSALAVLLEFRRACARAGKTIVVQGVPCRLQDLATLYGVGELLPRA
ncbi:MAG: STAS domain-containing protein [Rhodoferax sp.]|uniref:STAS domain-containing protein n=1 Tax=Rhodoferax sp. TaxID=50421 RepID=UPI00260F166A|nr:STAS domain-containing protein [Rhodoferax sp.]MDD5332909.1 STAS domain-containing protein [Rhodoferax sp.]